MNLNETYVCYCNMVTGQDVKDLLDSNIEITQIQEKLKIGQRCGGCIPKDSPTIDIHFEELIKLTSPISLSK